MASNPQRVVISSSNDYDIALREKRFWRNNGVTTCEIEPVTLQSGQIIYEVVCDYEPATKAGREKAGK